VAVSCNQRDQAENKERMDPKQDSLLYEQAKGHFKALPDVLTSRTNPVTTEKVALGHILFYDPRLSSDGKTSCNNCHNLSNYGTDHLSAAQGGTSNPMQRNAPTVFNAALHNMFFWDGRALTIDEQPGKMILDPDERAIPHLGFLVDRLRHDTLYTRLFAGAFPGDKVPLTYTNVKRAIGAFERTLLTPSRFDTYMNGDLPALTADEKRGLRVFIDSGCTNCHYGVGAGGGSIKKFGIYTDYRTLIPGKVDDQGRMNLTRDSSDKDQFKVPGLRNVEMTYPYFHNGGITSLDSAVKIMGKTELNKNLSGNDVRDIVSFLKTLTGEIREEYSRPPGTVPAKSQ
jgi:cytochrome c peroxidase